MMLSGLDLPKPLIEAYGKKGITELYPPQEECVKKGLLEGRNLLISIPTASGKTLVAEMAMHHHIAGKVNKGPSKGKCLYVVPLKALASEKYEEFSGKGVRIGIATGDLDKRDEYLGQNDIIITTSEKADSLLRNNTRWMNLITCLVVDEAHLIDSENRGATLEMVITKLRYLNENMQVIALTATIGNPRLFAGWLEAEHVSSEWRPVDLKEGVFYSDTIYFEEEEKKIKTPAKEDDTNLCLDCIEDGGQSLVFVSSRRNAEGFAKRMAKALEKSGFSDPALEDIQKKLEAIAETDMGKILASCTAKGAAFHHAGMKREQRHIIEQGFRDGYIKVISSTPTLAAGLNLPARRVVIRDFLRFKGGEGMLPIPVREYRQMAGRAGRPHLDPYGEAVLIAKGRDMANGLFEEFISAPAEDVKSRLDDESALCSQVLSLISTEFVKNNDDLVSFLKRTFYTFTNKKSSHLSDIVEKAVSYLEAAGMITKIDDRLFATDYGNLVSHLYINPISAEIISTVLREKQKTLLEIKRLGEVEDIKASDIGDLIKTEPAKTTKSVNPVYSIDSMKQVKSASAKSMLKKTAFTPEDISAVFSDIGLLQLLCKTPDMYTLYVRKDDLPVLESFYYAHEDELWMEISYDTMEDDFRVLKTAMLLDNWISEIGEDTICTRFGVGPGDIYNVVEGMNWLLYSASRISYMMAPDLKISVSEVELRMKNGIKRELIPLIKLKNVGRVRARRLFNNGITSPLKIKEANFDKLSAILGQKIAGQVIKQVEKEYGNINNTEIIINNTEIKKEHTLREGREDKSERRERKNRKIENQKKSAEIIKKNENFENFGNSDYEEEEKNTEQKKENQKNKNTQRSLFEF